MSVCGGSGDTVAAVEEVDGATPVTMLTVDVTVLKETKIELWPADSLDYVKMDRNRVQYTYVRL
jgi:hypothetical protein